MQGKMEACPTGISRFLLNVKEWRLHAGLATPRGDGSGGPAPLISQLWKPDPGLDLGAAK